MSNSPNTTFETKERRNTRKRKRDETIWKCNVKKLKHDRGEEYVSVRKKAVPPRRVEPLTDCLSKCVFKCAQKITEEEQQFIPSTII